MLKLQAVNGEQTGGNSLTAPLRLILELDAPCNLLLFQRYVPFPSALFRTPGKDARRLGRRIVSCVSTGRPEKVVNVTLLLCRVQFIVLVLDADQLIV